MKKIFRKNFLHFRDAGLLLVLTDGNNISKNVLHFTRDNAFTSVITLQR